MCGKTWTFCKNDARSDMTPIILIICGLIVIGISIWSYYREEADILFWMEYLSWDVNKAEHPILYRLALAIQLVGALILIAIGTIWLIYFA